MNNEQMIKQAYVRGLAARGILRMRAMQKQAASGPAIAPRGQDSAYSNGGLKVTEPDFGSIAAMSGYDPLRIKGKRPWSRGASDALAGAGGAGIGAIIGALVAYARKKKILGHALAGAGIGGLAGVGGNELYRYLTNKDGLTPEQKFMAAIKKDDTANIPVDAAAGAGLSNEDFLAAGLDPFEEYFSTNPGA
ncbi:MAG: hypothetical protein IJF84_00445 [Thermoguttaceae bacterium]|nr:hypothetical protein [Thermoguttaceae bacterium]